jgi:hypothetical protein
MCAVTGQVINEAWQLSNKVMLLEVVSVEQTGIISQLTVIVSGSICLTRRRFSFLNDSNDMQFLPVIITASLFSMKDGVFFLKPRRRFFIATWVIVSVLVQASKLVIQRQILEKLKDIIKGWQMRQKTASFAQGTSVSDGITNTKSRSTENQVTAAV